MTQAMNLANFANSLDSSGQMPPTNLSTPVPISKGGTNASTASAARTSLGLAIGTDVAAQAYAVPVGAIIMWSGSIASIPSGWLLCNGSSGTPDLRDRFIVGAGSTYSPGNTGGSANAIVVSHTHTISGSTGAMNSNATHSHTQNPVVGSGTAYIGGGSTGTAPGNTGTANIDHTHDAGSLVNSTVGSSATNANLPPYYALAFIMKT